MNFKGAGKSPSNDGPTTVRRLSLSVKTLIGLLVGVACGVFFGELCGWLQIVGDAFVGLLQMTVLPYISISLIASVGRLAPRQAGRLCGRVGLILFVLWMVGLLMVVLSVLTFPTRESAAFYSSTLIETPNGLNFLDLFVPTNPFRALSENWIPAVVIFCVGLGVAAMAMPHRTAFLAHLDNWLDILKRLNGYVALLTPYGVFAIMAAATGTMTIEELARTQAYLLSFTAAAVLLTFFVLPALVTSCTPFRYRDVLDVTMQAMITAFVTAKLIVVLPLLIEKTHEMFAKYGQVDEEVKSDVEVVYPLMYPIPNLGKLLSLIFVPFTAWFVGSPLDAGDYPSLLILGSVTYFGKPLIAMPFLLDMFRLPADMFQLFVVSGVYCARIGDVLAVMHLFSLTVLGTCATRGMFKLRFGRLAVRMGTATVVGAIMFFGLRAWLARTTLAEPSRESIVSERQLLRHPSPSVVREEVPSQPVLIGDDASRLDAIRVAGVIRVGFLQDNLPYSYFNGRGELVGYDIDLAHLLAEELECDLEFIPFEFADLEHHLDANHFDFAVGGLPITTLSLLSMRSCETNLDVSASFVVRDHRRREFSSMEGIRQLGEITIAVPGDDHFRSKLSNAVPNARLVPITGVRHFFDDEEERFDALLIDAESGSAWTFLYPGYRPVVPDGLEVKLPLGIAIARDDTVLSDFLAHWVELKKRTGELDELYRYWILGQVPSERPPRWSILRNVLGIGVE